MPIPGIGLADQFVTAPVNLTNLGKLGVPVSKAHAPDPPSGVLLRPDEHLAWYEFFEPKALQLVRVKNQFEAEAKGAIWTISDAQFLLVPAIKDGGVANGGITLEQHWKCYNAAPFFDPSVTVNLQDQFHLEADVVVGSGRYLCNPVEKTHDATVYPIVVPAQHLACYDIPTATCETTVCGIDSSCCISGWTAACVTQAALSCGSLCTLDPSSDCCNATLALGCDGFPQSRTLDDQFGNHPALVVENPEMLCLPAIKYLPEPGVLVSFGSGLMLLGWLDRRRKRSPAGPRRATARGKKVLSR